HIAKLNGAIARARLFHANHVSERHPVLFASGADDRVHNYASVPVNPPAHTDASRGNSLNLRCLLCLHASVSKPTRASPERVRGYRQTEIVYRGRRKPVKPNGVLLTPEPSF